MAPSMSVRASRGRASAGLSRRRASAACEDATCSAVRGAPAHPTNAPATAAISSPLSASCALPRPC
jgi:hypothetical protein